MAPVYHRWKLGAMLERIRADFFQASIAKTGWIMAE